MPNGHIILCMTILMRKIVIVEPLLLVKINNNRMIIQLKIIKYISLYHKYKLLFLIFFIFCSYLSIFINEYFINLPKFYSIQNFNYHLDLV